MSVWRNTLDHFDAIKIGLTATPAAHTKAYFRDVVYRYEYARAVREGYLVDYDVVNIKSNVRMKGVFLKEGETVEVVDPDTGNERLDLLEDERDFASTEVERTVTSPDSNRKILEEIKKYALEHEQRYGRFPKTLIFAANDLPHTSHADQLVELAVDVFGRGEGFVRKITGRADRPLQEIRAVPQPPEAGHRRLGGPDVDRRGHSGPGVHRLSAAGQVPHPVRADAGARDAQGREASRTSPTSRCSTASTARC